MMFFKYKQSLLMGDSLNLLTESLKILLLKPSYVYNVNHEFLSDIISEEIVGSGYITGGSLLTNKSIAIVQDRVDLKADNIIWNLTSSIVSRYAVIYQDTGDALTSRLVLLKDFYHNRVAVNSSFTVEFDTNGILSLK